MIGDSSLKWLVFDVQLEINVWNSDGKGKLVYFDKRNKTKVLMEYFQKEHTGDPPNREDLSTYSRVYLRNFKITQIQI